MSNRPESSRPQPAPREGETTPTRTAPTADAAGKKAARRAARPDVPVIDPADTQDAARPSAKAKSDRDEQAKTARENVREGYR